MTRNTEEFIRSLGANLVPVRPLRRPWIRAAIWLAFSLPYLAVMVFVMTPRNDLLSKLSDTRFVVEQIAALTTGIVAAAAAFAMVVPGYTRKLLMVLLFPAAIWLGSLSRGCLLDWSQRGVGGLSLRSDWMCLPAIILMGAIPAVAMAIMLRRGAPLAPRVTTALGGSRHRGLWASPSASGGRQRDGASLAIWRCVRTIHHCWLGGSVSLELGRYRR